MDIKITDCKIVSLPVKNLDNEIFDTKGHLLAKCWRKDITDFIVKAVNCKAKLLDACQKIEAIEKSCKERGVGYDQQVHKIAEAAVAKTKKKE